MTDTELWAKFEKTGCIMDYLSYKGVVETGNKEAGEKVVESDDCSDGNDSVGGSYR